MPVEEPADVDVDPDADVIDRPSASGKGDGRRFHKPRNFYTDKPACHTAKALPDEKWKRKQRKQLGDHRQPCKSCYDPTPVEEYDNGPVECPLCKEPTDRSLGRHLRNDCPKNI